jgi:two-component system, cell cycle response regulator
MSTSRTHTGEIVPLADRMITMRWLRLVMAVAVVVYSLVGTTSAHAPAQTVLVVTLGYLAVLLGAELVWRIGRQRWLFLFGLMLLADGLYLSWAATVTGGTHSSLRYLLVLHLVAVTLLASYRTGLKMALWHSILPLSHYHLQDKGLVPPNAGSEEMGAIVGFVLMLWVVAMGTATFSAMNERELRRRKIDLEALARLATDLEHAMDQPSVAKALVQSLVDNFDFSRVAVLGAEGDGALVLASSTGLPSMGAIERLDGASALRHAGERRTTLLVTHLDPDCDPELRTLWPGACNLLITPLLGEQRWLGSVVAEHGLRAGSRIERRVVSTVERFTAHAALALLNAALLERVQTLATTDPLTGLANRRMFEATMRAELARTARTGDPTALVLCDIDRFKTLNDVHGHQVGDRVLQGLADVLLETVREYDTVGRHGGEEFTVVMPACGLAEASQVAERLRAAVEAAPLPVPITASFGVALAPSQGDDIDTLLKAADDALYRSKADGRNRVTVSDRIAARRHAATSNPGA